MHLFLIDYIGTLTTLADPVEYMKALRQRYPKALFILHTADLPSGVNLRHLGLLEQMDGLWSKPCPVREQLDALSLSRVTIVDDDPFDRRALARELKGKVPYQVQILDQVELLALLMV